jgi:hypothetical protein
MNEAPRAGLVWDEVRAANHQQALDSDSPAISAPTTIAAR